MIHLGKDKWSRESQLEVIARMLDMEKSLNIQHKHCWHKTIVRSYEASFFENSDNPKHLYHPSAMITSSADMFYCQKINIVFKGQATVSQ